jgi:RNA polymerase sigma factor (sigma-70 family)
MRRPIHATPQVNQNRAGALYCDVIMAADGLVPADRQAFETTVRGETRALFALAFSILRDAQEAEDAVQDTLVAAWRAWSTLRDPERASAWLRRICVRRCLDIRRNLFRRLFLSDRDERTHPTERLDAMDPDLDRAFRRLTSRQRAVTALHYRHGYTLDECALLMGCRPGTARSHLNRALRTLRKELKDEET